MYTDWLALIEYFATRSKVKFLYRSNKKSL